MGSTAPTAPTVGQRWFPLPNHPGVQGFLGSRARFNIVPAGRRSYKTETAKRRAIRKALTERTVYGARYIFCAPVRDQAKRIFWDDLKALVPEEFYARKPQETELTIRLVTGNELQVVGMDRPQRVEGASPIAHAVLDEYADMKPEAWDNHIGPALTDFGGTADFIGVPEGRNHYYDLYREAQADLTGFWAAWHWTSEEILAAEEIEYWRNRLDPNTYAQEFLASFVAYLGRAYYPFEDALHADEGLPYDPHAPLNLCFDFNQAPGVAAVVQEAATIDRTMVLGQVYIPTNSRTPMVCDALLDGSRHGPGYRDHAGLVYLYGDATGGAQGSAKVEGSDWDLIRKKLRPVFGDRLIDRVPKANPRERARVNAVNARLLSDDGSVRLVVDAKRAPNVVRDFEGVRTVEGGTGEIDKKRHRADGLTHISDAIGYYVAAEYPVRGSSAFVREEY